MPRVAIYARYSSDNQRDASIEDQIMPSDKAGPSSIGMPIVRSLVPVCFAQASSP